MVNRRSHDTCVTFSIHTVIYYKIAPWGLALDDFNVTDRHKMIIVLIKQDRLEHTHSFMKLISWLIQVNR